MKKLLIIVTALLIIAAPLTLKAENAGYVISGGVWTDDGFEKTGGGFLTGVTFSLDESRGLYGRALYHKFNIGAKPVQTVNLTALLKYKLGKRYSLYFNVGAEEYMTEDVETTIVGGVGLEKTIWSGPLGEDIHAPWSMRLFAEVDFVNQNIDTGDGKTFRIFIGLIFTPVVKK